MKNACNGCGDLEAVPSEACDDGEHPGPCGTWTCSEDRARLTCEDDDSEAEIWGNSRDDDCDGVVDGQCNGCPDPMAVPAGWAYVPAGVFVMGSPGNECPDRECADPRCPPPQGSRPDGQCPGREIGREDGLETQHTVRIRGSFLIKTVEVTQAEYFEAVGDEPSQFSECGSDCPVESVNWYQAVAYCNTRSQLDSLPRCYVDDAGNFYDLEDANNAKTPLWHGVPNCIGYRLPTETEWEYAARAGTSGPVQEVGTPWSIGENGCSEALTMIASYACNSNSRTYPVGQLGPNPWGLHDTLGNVREWVWDVFASDYGGLGTADEPLADPRGPERGDHVGVLRGGGWSDQAKDTRAASRVSRGFGVPGDDAGFRIVRSLP